MDLKKGIEIIIEKGNQLVQTSESELKEEFFHSWFNSAENIANKLFGEDWKEYAFWTDYKPGSWSDDKIQLKRAIESLQSAKSFLLLEEISIKDQRQIQNLNKVEKSESTIKQIFIVHGHDNVAKLELKNYLQNILKLPEPIILHEKPNRGKAIIEKFEEFATASSYAFVLLTPDDIIASTSEDEKTIYRARQNVIFEMGYFLGLFGRNSGRVILLYKGKLDIPSDISGLVYINISNGVESAGEKIRKELSIK